MTEVGWYALEVSSDGESFDAITVRASSPIIAYLSIQGSPWYDVASGFTYRWAP